MRKTLLTFLTALTIFFLAPRGFAAEGPGCDRASLQARLNGGESAFTLYKACGRSLSLLYGLNYKNGLLAWLDTANGSGFVATPTDLPYGAFWDNMSQAGWTTVSGTSPAMGAGKSNTAKIIAVGGVPQPLPGINYYNYAAYASTLTINGRADWYLPSQEEMVQVFKNLPITISACVINNGDPGYWTSTQTNYNKAVFVNCEGFVKTERTNSVYGVRMVRAFVDSAPEVKSLNPSTVRVGTELMIAGKNFSATPGLNSVLFTGNVTAVATASTPTSLRLRIPAGTQSGPVTITSDGNKGAPSVPQLTVEVVPTLTSFSPQVVQAGDTLTITGASFSPNPASNTVVFTGFPMMPFAATTTSLKVVVPSQAVSGPIQVGTLGVLSEPSRDTLLVTQSLTFVQAPQRLVAYTVNGYAISGVFLNAPCKQDCIYVGGNPGQAGRSAYASSTGTRFRLARSDAKPFRLRSVALSLLNPKVGPQKVVFRGTRASGDSVRYSVYVNWQAPPATIGDFPTSFDDLTEVNWDPVFSTLISITVKK